MPMLRTRAKLAVKQVLFPVAFQFPPIVLAPERLRLWLGALSASTDVDGDVVEIGCAFGGTAAYASSFLERTSDARRYLAYDTFEGSLPTSSMQMSGEAQARASARRSRPTRCRWPVGSLIATELPRFGL